MKLSRLKPTIRLTLFVCLLGVPGLASPQTDIQVAPEVAQNIGETIRTEAAKIIPPNHTDTASFKSRDTSTGLTRIGVQTAQPLTLSLQDAIRRALENNNDVEVSRGDVRFQETQVRSLLGVYDPVFTVSPTYSRSNTTGSPATNDFRINAGMTQFFQRGGGNIQPFF